MAEASGAEGVHSLPLWRKGDTEDFPLVFASSPDSIGATWQSPITIHPSEKRYTYPKYHPCYSSSINATMRSNYE